MTVQPTRDQLLDMTERLGFLGDRPELCDEVVDGLWAALDRAEHRIARLEAQTDIRGRAVVMYRERARQAEAERDEWRQTALDERAAALDALKQIKVRDARIKAVRALHTGTRWPGVTDMPICDACDQPWPCPTIRALDGDA